LKYDDASWHYGGEFPKNSPNEYGGVHIALFMRWCFIQGWAGQVHHQNHSENVENVIDGKLSAVQFLFSHCDGKLTSDDLNHEGNVFAQQYYGDDGLYITDYMSVFGELMYAASEEAHDFRKLSDILDDRRSTGLLTKRQLKKVSSWWKLW